MNKPIIPAVALGQHIAVLGKNGSGKSFATKAVIVEPLLAAGKLVAVVDPTSAWYGLRSSADGKGPGFKVVVFGGDHGDLPLPSNSGAAVARLIVEQHVSVVIDTGNLSVGERTRWMIDFAGTIYRINRTPLYLVVDEMHVFAPQGKVPDPDTGKMLHAVNQLASGGRSRGIRLTMITQRPQKLHKDALTTADTLIAMRVLAPQDREAVKAWIDGCGDPAQGRQVLDSLAGLQRGEGWVWYPEGGHLQRVKFPPIRTFDSSATPADGQTVRAPKGAAEIDLGEIRKALADAVAEAEANDPKALRAKIVELQRQLSDKGGKFESGPTPEWRAEYEATHARDTEAAYKEGFNAGAQAVIDRLNVQVLTAHEAITHIKGVLDMDPAHSGPGFFRVPPTPAEIATARLRRDSSAAPAHRARETSAPPRSPLATGGLQRAERQVLIALAQLAPARASRAQLSILSGYSIKSSSFSNALSALRTAGYLDGRGDDNLITDAGRKVLGNVEPRPSGRQLVEWWVSRLEKAERVFLLYLVDVYPKAATKEQISAATGYSVISSSFSNALSKLRTLQLVHGRAEVKASEEFFR